MNTPEHSHIEATDTRETPSKREYSAPTFEAFGEIRSATLGIPSPSGESGNEGTHRDP